MAPKSKSKSSPKSPKSKITAPKITAPKPSAPVKITAKDVLPWATKRKTFTTGQVSEQFNVTPGQAAALVAILRIKEAIEPNGKGSDGTSAWTVA